jgi:MOSC domain-containing protein YiiM
MARRERSETREARMQEQAIDGTWGRRRVLSVNVGLPREIRWRGKSITTGIYKKPVAGPVRVHTLNLDGDRQADLRVHGGRDKAVYAYPSEFYELWRQERPDLAFPFGQFGENVTIEGLVDDEVNVGDRLRMGTAEVVVTQPRFPCFKLGIKMGRDEFVTDFLDRRLYGFYLSVAREGEVRAGDPIVMLHRHPSGFGVTEVARLYADDRADVDGLRQAVELDVLHDSWREYFRRRLERLGATPARR